LRVASLAGNAVASDLTSNVADLRGLTVDEFNERLSPLIAGGWLDPVKSQARPRKPGLERAPGGVHRVPNSGPAETFSF
jgi:hypothetical protein